MSPGSGEKYGALVYATPDIATASIFMARVAGYWSVNIFDGVQCVIIAMDRDDFIRNDHGGCIYVFSSDSFSANHESGMGELEWVSEKAVRPIKKIKYPSSLDAMIEYGAQVFFVDEEQYTEMQKSPEHALCLLKKISSENKKRNKNLSSIF